MENIVIIGSGLAGWNLARELRKNSPEIKIKVITADAGEAYPKPQLSAALSKGAEPDALIQQQGEDWSRDLAVELITHTRVAQILADVRQIQTEDGRQIPYDKLVLASGARPIQVNLAGNGAEQVYRVNNLNDYRKFREALVSKKRVAVLGSGLIGIEFAHDLASAGFEVDLIGLDAWPMAMLLPQELGQELRSKLENMGVRFHLGVGARAVHQLTDGVRVDLSAESQSIDTDLVLAAIGLAPDLGLAQKAGLLTGRGIQVDRQLRTSNEHIFALGDAAEIEGNVLPFVMPLLASVKVLAQVLLGRETRLSLPAMPIVLKTPSWPIVGAPDFARRAGQWQIEQGDTGSRAIKVDDSGKVLAFALTGDRTSERSALLKQMDAVLD